MKWDDAAQNSDYKRKGGLRVLIARIRWQGNKKAVESSHENELFLRANTFRTYICRIWEGIFCPGLFDTVVHAVCRRRSLWEYILHFYCLFYVMKMQEVSSYEKRVETQRPKTLVKFTKLYNGYPAAPQNRKHKQHHKGRYFLGNRHGKRTSDTGSVSKMQIPVFCRNWPETIWKSKRTAYLSNQSQTDLWRFMEILHHFDKCDFHPMPSVDSVLLHLTRKAEPDLGKRELSAHPSKRRNSVYTIALPFSML